MGGPGSGPKKGQRSKNRYKSFRKAAGYEEEKEPYVAPIFPREVIDEIGVFDDPDREQTYPRHGDRSYTKTNVTAILDAILRGVHIRAATGALGINERTYYKWIDSRPDFKSLTDMAKAITASHMMEALNRLAMHDDNVLAMIAWLNNQGRDFDWGKGERVDVNVQITGSVDVQHLLSDPRLIELENEAEARRQQLEDGSIEAEFKELPAHTGQEDLLS
jgi:hypothetical protein